ncbi:hypothetical protein ACOSQ4_009144 [Xanthoceras sorbifolium]
MLSIKLQIFLGGIQVGNKREDTRYSFISHLLKAFRDQQIEAFIDNELIRGDEISASLLKAIEQSQVSVVIFSRNYASSKWCLQELENILQCREKKKQIVIPVFYGVDPSDVRHQTGSFKKSLHKVKRWKKALNKAANLSGFDSSVIKSESKLIEAIVTDVLKRLNDLSSSDCSPLVGIDSKIKQIESLLCIETNSVRGV